MDAIDYYNRGNDFRKKGQYDSAIEDYNKAIQLDPNLAQAYGNRGLAHGRKGEYDRSIEDCSKAIALNPDDPSAAYINRSLAYSCKGEYDRAIEDCNKAIALDPNNALAHDLLSELKDKRKAEVSSVESKSYVSVGGIIFKRDFDQSYHDVESAIIKAAKNVDINMWVVCHMKPLLS